MIKRVRDEAGYSLVEVMASIVILSIAIIPMVGMFDMGLNAASRGSSYDKARALANRQLESAKSLPYGTVRNSFPNNTTTCNLSTGDGDCDPELASGGFSYTVTKRFIDRQLSNPNTSTDAGVMRVTVTVSRDGDTYPPVTGVVSE